MTIIETMGYNKLTKTGKLRRLRRLAQYALSEYDLSITGVTFHCFETNLLYRVHTQTGERYILRLASPGWRTFEDLRAEAMWLSALGADTDIPVPRIILTKKGISVLPVQGKDVPDVWNATLMSWQPGRILGKCMNPANLRKMGELFWTIALEN